MPDAEMREDINVRIAGQATSPGLVVYHLQRVTRDRVALREIKKSTLLANSNGLRESVII
jgi:hypothetical protein